MILKPIKERVSISYDRSYMLVKKKRMEEERKDLWFERENA